VTSRIDRRAIGVPIRVPIRALRRAAPSARIVARRADRDGISLFLYIIIIIIIMHAANDMILRSMRVRGHDSGAIYAIH